MGQSREPRKPPGFSPGVKSLQEHYDNQKLSALQSTFGSSLATSGLHTRRNRGAGAFASQKLINGAGNSGNDPLPKLGKRTECPEAGMSQRQGFRDGKIRQKTERLIETHAQSAAGRPLRGAKGIMEHGQIGRCGPFIASETPVPREAEADPSVAVAVSVSRRPLRWTGLPWLVVSIAYRDKPLVCLAYVQRLRHQINYAALAW